MFVNPRASMEDLVRFRSEIDTLIHSIATLFLSEESPPPPPLPVRFRAVVEPLRPHLQQPSMVPESSHGDRVKSSLLRPDAFKGMSAWEAVEKFLVIRGKTARTAEIALALMSHGFQTSSQNPRGFIFQILRKKPQIFSHPDKGIWGLKRWEDD